MLCFDASLLLVQEKTFKHQSENWKFEAGTEKDLESLLKLLVLTFAVSFPPGGG